MLFNSSNLASPSFLGEKAKNPKRDTLERNFSAKCEPHLKGLYYGRRRPDNKKDTNLINASYWINKKNTKELN